MSYSTDPREYEDYIITGFPECPGCGVETLKLRDQPDVGQTYWYCPSCGNWQTSSLIKALCELENE